MLHAEYRCIPEIAFCSHGQILKHEPESKFAIRVVESARVDSIHANEISSMILVDIRSLYRHRH
jgi:hypothetical protein